LFNPVDRLVVDKEFVLIEGEPYYRIYFYDVPSGQIIPVLSPVRMDKAIIIQRRN